MSSTEAPSSRGMELGTPVDSAQRKTLRPRDKHLRTDFRSIWRLPWAGSRVEIVTYIKDCTACRAVLLRMVRGQGLAGAAFVTYAKEKASCF